MWVGGQHHAPAALPPGRTGTYCIGGWVGPRVDKTGTENLFITGARIPDLTVPRQSPCLLRCYYTCMSAYNTQICRVFAVFLVSDNLCFFSPNINLEHQNKFPSNNNQVCDKWVPVTTAWRFLKLLMEEPPPIWNILNKQLRTADKGWSSSLGGLGVVLTTPHRKNVSFYQNVHTENLGPGLIIWYYLNNGKGHEMW